MARPIITKPTLLSDLRSLGVGDFTGSAVMVHTQMSALGTVIGGAQTVVEALIEVLGPDGTLLVLTGAEDRPPYHQDDWDDDERRAYREQAPAFDPRLARAERDHGRVPEAVRTWPGSHLSRHPVCGFAALGGRAAWFVAGQSLDEGYGPGSPLERLVVADGAVLLLGDLFENVTLLHYAEYQASVPSKRYAEYEMPVHVDGERVWRRIRELDSSAGAFDYEGLPFAEDAFEVITRSALTTGVGHSGTVGAAAAHLLPGRPLLEHAVSWMESHFGEGP